MSSKTIALLAALAAAPALGDDGASGSNLQIHGFVSQGYVLTTGNNVNGDSTGHGSFDYRELGANLSYRLGSNLLLAAQVASVKAGNAVEDDLVLDFAALDYAPLHTDWGRSGLRAGKLKLPFGFYNDARDAVFTRPSILLPQSVYLDNSGARAFGYFSLWGGAGYADFYAGPHQLSVELGAFPSQPLGDAAEVPILRANASGDFDSKHAVILRFADDYEGGRWRAAMTLSKVKVAYSPGAPPFALGGEFDFDQIVLSLQNNRERLSLTAEWVGRHIELDDLIPGPASSASRLAPGGYYLQGIYRFTPKWQGMLRYDEQYRDAADRSGYQQVQKQGASFLPMVPRYYYFGRDWTVGTRYDLRSNLGLWAEYHLIDGAGWVNPLDNPGFGSSGAKPAARHWDIFALMLAYRF